MRLNIGDCKIRILTRNRSGVGKCPQSKSGDTTIAELGQFKLQPLAIFKRDEPRLTYRRHMDKHVTGTDIRRDKAKALFAIEPFDGADCHGGISSAAKPERKTGFRFA
jgi:hypothetical protein